MQCDKNQKQYILPLFSSLASMINCNVSFQTCPRKLVQSLSKYCRLAQCNVMYLVCCNFTILNLEVPQIIMF